MSIIPKNVVLCQMRPEKVAAGDATGQGHTHPWKFEAVTDEQSQSAESGFALSAMGEHPRIADAELRPVDK
jgi:hypothetical protein